MALFPPIPLIRKRHIVKKLKQNGAISPETALTLAEVGVIKPNGFKNITNRLIRHRVIFRLTEKNATPLDNG